MRLLAWWRAWQQRRALLTGPHYVQQIQILKADRPMALPAVQPLKGTVTKKRRARTTRLPVEFRRTGTK
jgi:hypothetical protein